MANIPWPVRLAVDPASGAMSGRTGVKRSRIADLEGLFCDAEAHRRLAAERGDDIAYEVHEFRPEGAAPYDLVFGTSTLQPGRVGGEFFMTRGHIHIRTDRPEIYICQRGRGVMHMELPDGTTCPLEMSPGDVVHVPAFWIHRSVNVGEEPLITVFCYPADVGQDYGIIERAGGMRTLIVDDGAGGWAEIDNPRYRPRSLAEQEQYLAEAPA
jgi:glucose-6-phosphate isomerase, archaeal